MQLRTDQLKWLGRDCEEEAHMETETAGRCANGWRAVALPLRAEDARCPPADGVCPSWDAGGRLTPEAATARQ